MRNTNQGPRPPDAEEVLRRAKVEKRIREAEAALRDGGDPYWQSDWRQPSLLLLGNEGSGLDPALLQQGVTALTIPHQASVESLNVAVAAGVLLLERVRQEHDRRESAATALGA